MSERIHELTSTEQHIPAAEHIPASPAPDPHLIAACCVLIEWLLEAANDPAEDAEALAVDKDA